MIRLVEEERRHRESKVKEAAWQEERRWGRQIVADHRSDRNGGGDRQGKRGVDPMRGQVDEPIQSLKRRSLGSSKGGGER